MEFPEERTAGPASGQDRFKQERFFIWLDENGVRCGPRHQTMKAALNFKKMNVGGAEVTYGEKYPSHKPPRRLIVAELVERPMTSEEEEGYKMWETLQERGLA